jgi:long-subunit fatty acid transport protein
MCLRRALLWLTAIGMLLPGALAAQNQTFGIALPRALTFATSPSPVGSGARAQGQAVAFIGVADDATAASHNPGGLVQLERPEVSMVGSYFLRVENQDVTQPATMVADQRLQSFDLNYLSLAYPLRLFQRSLVVSLNFQRLFDLQGVTETSSGFTIPDPTTGFLAGVGRHAVHSEQKGGLFSISPALAVQLSPAVSVGMAVNFWPPILDNGWKQDVNIVSTGHVFSGNRLVPFTATGRIREEFDFEGVNITAGFLWTISSVFSLGGVVRSPFTASVRRTNRSSLQVTLHDDSAPVSSACTFQETLDLDMPLSYGLGLAARLSTHLRLALDVARVHWSNFRLQASHQEPVACAEVLSVATPVGKGQAILQGESEDTTSVRLGAEYLWVFPTVVLPLRAGVFYDPEPGAGGTDAFFGISLGAGLTIGPWLFDAAYTFRTGTAQSPATDTTVQQHTVLASLIYHFK